MTYNEMMDKLERVIKNTGTRITFIEDQIGLTRSTLIQYRTGRLKLKEDKQFKLQEVLRIYNV